MPSHQVKLECFCGKLKGNLQVVSNKSSLHVQCLCKDCQNFASYLKNEDKILDEHGASELFQTYPAYINIEDGIEHLTCIKLKEKGILRWHTSCCNTPVANTLASPKMPFAGISVKLMKFNSEEEKAKILGPIIMKAFGKSARGVKPPDAYDTFPKTFLPKIMKFMFIGYLKSKHQPSPFFKNGLPTVVPKVIG